MTAFEMYLFTRLDAIKDATCAFMVLFGTASILCIILYFIIVCDPYVSTENNKKSIKKANLVFVPLFALVVCSYVFVPTQKEMAAIIVVPKILSEQNVNNLTKMGENGFELMKLATDYMKDVLKMKKEGGK